MCVMYWYREHAVLYSPLLLLAWEMEAEDTSPVLGREGRALGGPFTRVSGARGVWGLPCFTLWDRMPRKPWRP